MTRARERQSVSHVDELYYYVLVLCHVRLGGLNTHVYTSNEIFFSYVGTLKRTFIGVLILALDYSTLYVFVNIRSY